MIIIKYKNSYISNTVSSCVVGVDYQTKLVDCTIKYSQLYLWTYISVIKRKEQYDNN